MKNLIFLKLNFSPTLSNSQKLDNKQNLIFFQIDTDFVKHQTSDDKNLLQISIAFLHHIWSDEIET